MTRKQQGIGHFSERHAQREGGCRENRRPVQCSCKHFRKVGISHRLRPNVQCWGDLRFSWYALADGDAAYRPVPVEMTLGPDLARPLHELWSTLENLADRLERLYRQLAGVRFEVITDDWGPGLILVIPLPERGDTVRVLVRRKEIRYYVERGGNRYTMTTKFNVPNLRRHMRSNINMIQAAAKRLGASTRSSRDVAPSGA